MIHGSINTYQRHQCRCPQCTEASTLARAKYRRAHAPDTLRRFDEWRDDAACLGEPTAWWFAHPDSDEHEMAVAICSTCPVARECAAEGRRFRERGKWGDYEFLKERRTRDRDDPLESVGGSR